VDWDHHGLPNFQLHQAGWRQCWLVTLGCQQCNCHWWGW
jgi:hypothetical protein